MEVSKDVVTSLSDLDISQEDGDDPLELKGGGVSDEPAKASGNVQCEVSVSGGEERIRHQTNLATAKKEGHVASGS